MSIQITQQKEKLQMLWGACREDRVKTDRGDVFILDSVRPVQGDPVHPEPCYTTLWLVPVGLNGNQEYRGRPIHFDAYPKINGVIRKAPNYTTRKREAVKDAMEFMKKRDG